MKRAVALIDGEHYPPVVRFALGELAHECEVVAAVFLGGTEKVDLDRGSTTYGVPLITGATPEDAVRAALEQYAPDEVVDLSDEPVVSSADRLRLASLALSLGVDYRGADFVFTAPVDRVRTSTPALGIIGTGKRVGKTAVSAFVARQLKAAGLDIVVLAMGRGGPAQPELIHGDQVELTTPDLLELARQGEHASSDNYEDAVMSRVTTVGCRRCGGGMAGETFFSNVPEGAILADSLGKELLVLEGSGSAIPPVFADASVLVIGAGRGAGYVSDYFGPYRISRADLAVISSAEEPVASAHDVERIREEIARIAPELPVVATTLRPVPLQPIAGRRVLFATTAPAAIAGKLGEYLAEEYGAHVVAVSTNLSDRSRLREDLLRYAGEFDTLVTELKAAAIDVVAEAGEEAGVPTVLCDNVPVAVDGQDLGELVDAAARLAIKRGRMRIGGEL
ncbi:MAG: 2,3-diphosphoglycerate synthetase [Actinobacteria bacterium HGW-Actinobacteria-7]|nr:MAG: 2,3-diphosphoglycerate synthetase [Actinobacteria bacterium HGW-Actinobacteria-7]